MQKNLLKHLPKKRERTHRLSVRPCYYSRESFLAVIPLDYLAKHPILEQDRLPLESSALPLEEWLTRGYDPRPLRAKSRGEIDPWYRPRPSLWRIGL